MIHLTTRKTSKVTVPLVGNNTADPHRVSTVHLPQGNTERPLKDNMVRRRLGSMVPPNKDSTALQVVLRVVPTAGPHRDNLHTLSNSSNQDMDSRPKGTPHSKVDARLNREAILLNKDNRVVVMVLRRHPPGTSTYSLILLVSAILLKGLIL